MEKVSYYTEAGLQKLIDELHTLKTKGRIEVAEQLSEARDKGDLSESAEYDAAKEAQAMLEMKIDKLERIVANARVISKADVDTSHVSILTKVSIKNKKLGTIVTYTLVAEEEADLKVGKISIESPMGQGLLGKKVGEMAIIDTPSGKLEFKILEIGI